MGQQVCIEYGQGRNVIEREGGDGTLVVAADVVRAPLGKCRNIKLTSQRRADLIPCPELSSLHIGAGHLQAGFKKRSSLALNQH